MANPHRSTPCTRTHQIGALLLVLTTFSLTTLLNHRFSPTCHVTTTPSVTTWQWRRQQQHRGPWTMKIYVYDEGEVDGLASLLYGRHRNVSPSDCLKGQWATQVKIHKMLLQSRFRTRRKEEADLFFVPTYVKCVRMMGGLTDKEINQIFVKVLGQMPYFRLSGGRDHMFVFPSGAGAHLFKSWATYLNRSIILTPEGDRTDKRNISAFNTWKDVIIPGNVDDSMTNHGSKLVMPLPLSKRKYLANFLGRAQGKVGRLQLLELAKQFPYKLESPELKLKGPDKLGKKEYFEHLRNAKFCLAPRGESSWTLRFYESFFVECVPVIISDYVELPFQNIIDYSQVSVKWPWTRIGPELLEYLESIPDKDIERMIENGRKVRCSWIYSSDSDSCSAFNGIMWELQRKVRNFHQSAETFWLHNGTIVNRDLVEFSHWKPPMHLP